MLHTILLDEGNHSRVGELLAYNSVFNTWSVEHYSKCSFRCAYCCCDTQGNSRSTVNPEKLLQILSSEWQEGVDAGLIIPGKTSFVVSCHADPYVGLDEKLLLTRRVIEFLTSVQQPFTIVTRGALVSRDFDLMLPFRDSVEIHFSLPNINPEYLRMYEPHTPPIEDRLRVIRKTFDAGLRTTVRIDPWIPDVTNVEAILQELPKGIDVLISPLHLSSVFSAVKASAISSPVDKPANAGSLMSMYLDFTEKGLGLTATRLFRHTTQAAINRAYILERNRIGFRRRVRWFYPPLHNLSLESIAFRYLKPGELQPDTGGSQC